MRNYFIRSLVSLLAVFSVLGMGCAPKAGEEIVGGDLASSDLIKEWTSTCDAKVHPVVSEADHVQRVLVLDGSGTYSYLENWYAGTCLPENYRVAHYAGGLWTVSGSTMAFHVLSSETASIIAFNLDVQDSFNTACGGTSPYQPGGDMADIGQQKTTYTMTCSNITLPNASNDDIYNTFSYSNGVLSLGENSVGVPGVFDAGSVPATATVNFN
nr:hypothetical protein CKG001_02870 [Bdellovibrio sp. CKG001]BFD65394.1 hypothetical protein HAGR004_04160 [Bdellovibrio sp. HAGR004]